MALRCGTPTKFKIKKNHKSVTMATAVARVTTATQKVQGTTITQAYMGWGLN